MILKGLSNMNNNNSKKYKKIVRRLRAKSNKKICLVHLLINAKSNCYNFGSLGDFYSKEIKLVLLSKSYEWEYGKRDYVLNEFADKCLSPFRLNYGVGFRTFCKDGKFYSDNPNEDYLPF